jgi:RHS repeat-associated protein
MGRKALQGRCRHAFAFVTAIAMILLSFQALTYHVSAVVSQTSPQAGSLGQTVYGPGIAITSLPDGRVRAEFLPTFQRWDGAWRPVSALNRSAAEWPYLLNETASQFQVTRLGRTFAHAKILGASYEFLPETIEETAVIRLVPQDGILSIPFSATYTVDVQADTIALKDGTAEIWTTSKFHAWDSADPARTWDRPVTSVAYGDGQLRLQLDAQMLATAMFPLYLDPTWKTNASMGWPSVTKTDVVEDLGDHNLRIGWFADNFNDGTKDPAWTTDTGSWWISGAQSQLNLSTRIRATSGGQWDTKFQAKVTVTASGTGSQLVRMLFRWKDASNYHYFELDEKNDLVALKKVVSGTTTTIWSGSKTIAVGTPYVIKIDAAAGSFIVTWDGIVIWSGIDPSTPAPSGAANIGFQTSGTKAKMAADDVRTWTKTLGSVTTNARNPPSFAYVPNAMWTTHSGSTYNGVDLKILSSDDNITWGEAHYVKAGAKSKSSEAESYSIHDADRKFYYRAQIDLRTTDDASPALAEIAVFEGGLNASDNSQLLGYESWQYYVDSMVNAVSGNLVLSATDLALPGKGSTLTFTRAYNSLSTASGPLGTGWTHRYNAFLTAGPSTVDFTDGDGSTHAFEDMGGGLYSSPRGLGAAKLLRNGDSTYTMSWKDASRWSFSSSGKLTQITDRNGNKVTVTYDGNGRLTKVADDSGIFLVLSYDGSGRINRVRDHNGTMTWGNFTSHVGSWTNGQNAISSNNLYANTNSNGALHTFSNYGLTGSASAWITKVEACVEAYTAGDDDLGVKISTNGGSTWSTEQIVNLPSLDPNALTCLDFTSHLASWSWSNLANGNFAVQIRYVKVGGAASQEYVDWIPARVTSASRYVSYAYDGSGLLANVTDALQKSDLYLYASGVLEKQIDRADRVMRFVKDFSSRVTEVWTGLYNRTTSSILWEFRKFSVEYGEWHNVRSALVTDALGNVTTIEYDRLAGRPIRIDGPLAASGAGCSCCGSSGSQLWTIDWDGEHNWYARADGRSSKTQVTYDWRANRVREADAVGNYTENTWQNRDNGTVFDSLLLKQRNKRAFFTTNEYDWKGNLIKSTDALGNFTRTFYTSAGFVNKTTDKRGFNTTQTYDAHGWRLNTTDPLGHTVKSEYDAVGRVVKTTTALNFVSRRAYNANDWVVSDTNPLNFVTSSEYNGRGDRTAVIDANGNRTTTVVNVTWAKAQKTIEATGDTTENTYDKLGRLVQVKDPRGKLWKYDFDKFGRQTNVTDPLGKKPRLSYDAAGNVVQRIDANGKYTNYTLYDALNRLKTVAYQDGNTLTYGYDANSNRVMESGYGFTRTTEYDALDRVKKMTFNFGSFSKVVQYTYDQNGNRKTMVYPDGFTVTYIWDADNRLVNMQIPGQTWTLLYDNDHRRTASRHPNGLELNATYDQASRLTDIRSKDLGSGSTVESFAYTHDKIANRKTLVQTNGTQLSFAYEEDYALNSTTYESGAKAYYFYDDNDNRLFRNETGGKRTEYDYSTDSSLSRREVWSGGTLQVSDDYTYDSNGNRLRDSRTVTGQGTSTYDFAYDLEDRLTRALVNLSEVASYAYFSDGARIRRTDLGTPTFFLYDFRDFNGYNDMLEEYDSAGNRVARYVHGPGIDEPLAMERGGAWYYYHFDGLGSVTMLTRADKTVANRYTYDDFGGFRSKTEAVTNVYTFTGREHDFATGLHFYRARYYDHVVGRFLTRDPAGMVDGANLYAYADNNPSSRDDPSGHGHCGWWSPCVYGCRIWYFNQGCYLQLIGWYAWTALSCAFCIMCFVLFIPWLLAFFSCWFACLSCPGRVILTWYYYVNPWCRWCTDPQWHW